MMLAVDEELQAIADEKDADKISEAADVTLVLDGDDSTIDGIVTGLKLAAKAQKLQRQTVGKKVMIFKITFSEYVDDDGIAIFVGAKESVRKRLKKL
jgi:polygalacturonase